MDTPQESIMGSALRTFCKALFGAAGLLIGVIFVWFVTFLFIGGRGPMETTNLMIAPDANNVRELLPQSAPVILRINIDGVIGMDQLTGKDIELQLADSQGPVIKKGRVKGVFLNINSPGGYSTEIEQIYAALMAYKKRFGVPIFAYVEGLCASGGVWLSCAAEKIYSSPVGIIGSVGVRFGPTFNVSEVMEKIGIQSLTLTRGKDKDALNPFRPWKEGEDDSLQTIIAYEYERFIDVVTNARPRINKQALINTYGANVFDPVQAQKIGFIDESNSSYSEALEALVESVGIKKDERYQVIELIPQRNFINELLEGKAFGIDKLQKMFHPTLDKRLQCLYHG